MAKNIESANKVPLKGADPSWRSNSHGREGESHRTISTINFNQDATASNNDRSKLIFDIAKHSYGKDSTAEYSMPRNEDIVSRIQRVPSEYSPPPARRLAQASGQTSTVNSGRQVSARHGEGMPSSTTTVGDDGVIGMMSLIAVHTTRREYVVVHQPDITPEDLENHTVGEKVRIAESNRALLENMPSGNNIARQERASHNLAERKPIQRYMRVRRYSHNADGTKELIGEDEMVFDPEFTHKNPQSEAILKQLRNDGQKVVRHNLPPPLPKNPPTPIVQPKQADQPAKNQFQSRPKDQIIVQPTEENVKTHLRRSSYQDPGSQSFSQPHRQERTSVPRLIPLPDLPPYPKPQQKEVSQPRPSHEQDRQPRPSHERRIPMEPKITVTTGKPVARRDLSPNIESQFFNSDKYSQFKTGDVIETHYVETEPGEIFEEILRKTEKSVRKEKRPAVSNGEPTGAYIVKDLDLNLLVKNRPGKKLADFVRKIPQNQAEKTPTFKGDSFRNPFTKDNQNNRQTLKTTQNNVAAPRASNSSNQEKLIDEKSFFLDSMELKSLPQSDNFAGLPGSSVIQQQTMNHTPSNQVTHQNRKDDRGPFNISPSDNNSRNMRAEATFDSVLSDKYQKISNNKQHNADSFGNPVDQGQKLPTPDQVKNNQRPSNNQTSNADPAKKQPLRLVFQMINGKRIPVSIENDDIPDREKKLIIDNYLKREGITEDQLQQVSQKSRSPSPSPKNQALPQNQQASFAQSTIHQPDQLRHAAKNDLKNFIEKSLDLSPDGQKDYYTSLGESHRQEQIRQKQQSRTPSRDGKMMAVAGQGQNITAVSVAIQNQATSLMNDGKNKTYARDESKVASPIYDNQSRMAGQHSRMGQPQSMIANSRQPGMSRMQGNEISSVDSFFKDMPDVSIGQNEGQSRFTGQQSMAGQPQNRVDYSRQINSKTPENFNQSRQQGNVQPLSQVNYSRQDVQSTHISQQQSRMGQSSRHSGMDQMNFDDFNDWEDDNKRPGASMMQSMARGGFQQSSAPSSQSRANIGPSQINSQVGSRVQYSQQGQGDFEFKSNPSNSNQYERSAYQGQNPFANSYQGQGIEEKIAFEKKITSTDSSLSIDVNSKRNVSIGGPMNVTGVSSSKYSNNRPPGGAPGLQSSQSTNQSPAYNSSSRNDQRSGQTQRSPSPSKPLTKLPSTKKAQKRMKQDMNTNSQLLQIAEEEDDAFKYHSDFMEDGSPESEPVIVEIDKDDIDDYEDGDPQPMTSHVRRADERAAFGLQSEVDNFLGVQGGRERGNAYISRGAMKQSSIQSGVSSNQDQLRQPAGFDRIHFESQMKESNIQSTVGSRVQENGFGESAFGAFNESVQGDDSVYQGNGGRQYSQMGNQSQMQDPFINQSRAQNQPDYSRMGINNQGQSNVSCAPSRGQQEPPASYQQSVMKSKAGVDQSAYSREDNFSSQMLDARQGQIPQNMGNSNVNALGVSRGGNRAPVGFSAFGSIQGVE